MDTEICKSISKLVVKISTDPRTSLDEKLMKDLMGYAGQSEDYLKYAHSRLLKQLEKKHSEIRLGAFRIVNEFFKKSSFYRELLLDDFRPLLDLTVAKPLPPPTEAAENLKLQTIKSFEKWHNKFSKGHPRLPIAYNYIKNVLDIDFEDELKRNSEEKAKAEEAEEKAKTTQRTQVEKVRSEYNENQEDIVRVVTEMKNCLCLIIPKPEEFMGDMGDPGKSPRDGDDDNDSDDVDFQEHGINERFSINIQFNPFAKPKIEQNEDNEAVIENLKGLYAIAKNRYLPLVKKWFLIASKCDDSILFKQILDLKDSLSSEMNSFEDLNLVPVKKQEEEEEMDVTDDDSDFEEVPEKEGYEDFAIAPPVIPKEIASSSSRISSSSVTKSSVPSSTVTSWTPAPKPQTFEECHDPTYGLKPDKLKAVLTNSTCDKPEASTNNESPQKPSTSKSLASTNTDVSRKEKLLAVAPKLPYDIDLYHWEDKDLKAPSVEVADMGMHRFWQPLDREGEAIENPDGINVLRTRKIEFTGKFEPINRTCRAPLPSGKLCPRQDRLKCPFHGKIIPRDMKGMPTEPEDIARLAEEEKKMEAEKVPDWQEPKFLKELKDQIGIDLTIRKGKKGGKSFSEKYPGLTDIRKLKDTPRSRLEKKIFNKQSLKRVAEANDEISTKKFKDKFGDQFNYTHL